MRLLRTYDHYLSFRSFKGCKHSSFYKVYSLRLIIVFIEISNLWREQPSHCTNQQVSEQSSIVLHCANKETQYKFNVNILTAMCLREHHGYFYSVCNQGSRTFHANVASTNYHSITTTTRFHYVHKPICISQIA